MPITSAVVLRPIKQEEFAKLDYQVMRHAFDSQNELGRLCDEVIYQNDLAARLEAAGLGPVRTEVPATVTHRDFAKHYSIDLIVGDAAICELKTASSLVPENDAQLLNYLFLLNGRHGKLVNFRTAHVESKFINTGITPERRREFTIELHRWRDADDVSHGLHTYLLSLLEDWGGFLELPLYLDALTHFLGGEQRVLQMIPLTRASMPLGRQRLHMLTPETAFRLTALTENTGPYEASLQALLRHSPLRAIQWINLAHHRVQFVTLSK